MSLFRRATTSPDAAFARGRAVEPAHPEPSRLEDASELGPEQADDFQPHPAEATLEQARLLTQDRVAETLISQMAGVVLKGVKSPLGVRYPDPQLHWKPKLKPWTQALEAPRAQLRLLAAQARQLANDLGTTPEVAPEVRNALTELAARAELLDETYAQVFLTMETGAYSPRMEANLQRDVLLVHYGMLQPFGDGQQRLLKGPQELIALRERLAKLLTPSTLETALLKTAPSDGYHRSLPQVEALSGLDVFTDFQAAVQREQAARPKTVVPSGVYFRALEKSFAQLGQLETDLRELIPEFPQHRGMTAALTQAAEQAGAIEPAFRLAAKVAGGTVSDAELRAPGVSPWAQLIHSSLLNRRTHSDVPLTMATAELQQNLADLRGYVQAIRHPAPRELSLSEPPVLGRVTELHSMRLQAREQLARVLGLVDSLGKVSSADPEKLATLRDEIEQTATLYEKAVQARAPTALGKLLQSVEAHAISAQELWEQARSDVPQWRRSLYLENERRRLRGLTEAGASPLPDVGGAIHVALEDAASRDWLDSAAAAQTTHAAYLRSKNGGIGSELDRPLHLLSELTRREDAPQRWLAPDGEREAEVAGASALKAIARVETADERALVERMVELAASAEGPESFRRVLREVAEPRPGERATLLPTAEAELRRYALAFCSPAAREALAARVELGRVSEELLALAEASEDPAHIELASALRDKVKGSAAAAREMLVDFARFDGGADLPATALGTREPPLLVYAPARRHFNGSATKAALEAVSKGYDQLRWLPPPTTTPRAPEEDEAETRLRDSLGRIERLTLDDTRIPRGEESWIARFPDEVKGARQRFVEAKTLRDPMAGPRFLQDAQNLEQIAGLLEAPPG